MSAASKRKERDLAEYAKYSEYWGNMRRLQSFIPCDGDDPPDDHEPRETALNRRDPSTRRVQEWL